MTTSRPSNFQQKRHSLACQLYTEAWFNLTAIPQGNQAYCVVYDYYERWKAREPRQRHDGWRQHALLKQFPEGCSSLAGKHCLNQGNHNHHQHHLCFGHAKPLFAAFHLKLLLLLQLPCIWCWLIFGVVWLNSCSFDGWLLFAVPACLLWLTHTINDYNERCRAVEGTQITLRCIFFDAYVVLFGFFGNVS